MVLLKKNIYLVHHDFDKHVDNMDNTVFLRTICQYILNEIDVDRHQVFSRDFDHFHTMVPYKSNMVHVPFPFVVHTFALNREYFVFVVHVHDTFVRKILCCVLVEKNKEDIVHIDNIDDDHVHRISCVRSTVSYNQHKDNLEELRIEQVDANMMDMMFDKHDPRDDTMDISDVVDHLRFYRMWFHLNDYLFRTTNNQPSFRFSINGLPKNITPCQRKYFMA